MCLGAWVDIVYTFTKCIALKNKCLGVVLNVCSIPCTNDQIKGFFDSYLEASPL